jgi:PAS domain S-box-containing protein
MGILDLFKPDVVKLKRKKDIEGLVKALDCKDRDVRRDVMKALEELGELAIKPLTHLMEDVDGEIRLGAAEALGRINKDGVAILRGGLIKFVNTRVSKINGFSKRELIEKQFINFVAPEYHEKVLRRYKKRVSYEWAPNRYEIEIISKDSGKIPVEIDASLIEYGGRPADLVVLRDLSEQDRSK